MRPSVAIAALAPFVGEQFALIDAVVYGLCAFVVASLFFGVAVFFSTLFNDVWRPLLLTCLVAIALARGRDGVAGDARPVPGDGGRQATSTTARCRGSELLVSAAGAAGLVYAAAANVARRDF